MADAAEPISPELALVCPELRSRALAALPDPTWEALLAQTRTRAATTTVEETRPGVLGALATYLVGLLWPIVIGTVAAIAVTAVLTVVADAYALR